MKPFFTTLSVLLFYSVVTAQTTDETAEKSNRWHFAVNAGTHYLQSHYNGYYYDGKPRESIEEDRDVDFRKNFGIWIGGNINYRIANNWFLSSEVAFRSFKAGYKATSKNHPYINSDEVNIEAYEIVINPISVSRTIEINDNWKVPVGLGIHLALNLYHEHNYRRTHITPEPDLIFKKVYRSFGLSGAGFAMEAGLTRNLNKGEVSFLIIPTPRLWYFNGELPYFYFHSTTSGAIVKVQYAFK